MSKIVQIQVKAKCLPESKPYCERPECKHACIQNITREISLNFWVLNILKDDKYIFFCTLLNSLQVHMRKTCAKHKEGIYSGIENNRYLEKSNEDNISVDPHHDNLSFSVDRHLSIKY